MIVAYGFQQIPQLSSSVGLSIGMFDGMHLGHQLLISELKKRCKTVAMLTFLNHPAEVLKGKSPPLLCSVEQRLHLMEHYGVDLVIVLPFTKELADQSYDFFIQSLRKYLPFHLLMLGEGDAFGKDRKGDSAHVQKLGSEMDFEVLYAKKVVVDGETVSSGQIRKYVQEGALDKVKKFLGRPYSLYFRFESDPVDFRKGKIPLNALCRLPAGIYPVIIDPLKHEGLAHIEENPYLTINTDEDLSGQMIAITFK